MDFKFNEDQRAFQDAVRSFANRELKDGALALAHQDDYPYDIARKMSEQGLFGITLPEDKGGQGGTLLDAVIAIEEVALACPAAATWCRPATSAPSACWANTPMPISKSASSNPCCTATASSPPA